jgi:hypothetical protein
MTWHEDRKSRKVMKIEQKNSPETFMFPVVIELDEDGYFASCPVL